MLDEVEASIRGVFSELRERPPMSEEEFRYRLEPLRRSRAAAVRLLLDHLGAEDSSHDLAAAMLHEIAVADDVECLLAAFRDAHRSERARAEIAQVLAGVAGDRLAVLLNSDELARLSALSIETFLTRLRDRAGLTQVLNLYRQSSSGDRRALLDAVDVATRTPDAVVRLGVALDPLFPEEPEPGIRADMVRRLAARPEPSSARALARWVTICHGDERLKVKDALRLLTRRGVPMPPREAAAAAWISGADGTGCYNVGVSFPTALGLRDVLLACVSFEGGLRAVSLIAAVETDTVAEIRGSVEEGQGIPVATVDPPTAFRHLHEARRRSLELGRPMPSGYAAAAAYLERPVALSPPPPPPEPDGSDTGAESLLDHPAYASWVFAGAEIPGGAVDAAIGRRLRALARRALSRLESSAAPFRLVAMLRHQAEVHRLRSEHRLASRAAAAAREIEDRGISASPVALRMMERSLRASGAPGSPAVRPEVREVFKRRIEEGGALRRHEVLVLNLAEALSRQIEDLNESLPPIERLTFDQIERLALGAAELAAKEFTRDAAEQPVLPGLERPSIASPAQVQRRLRAQATRLALERAVETLVALETRLDRERARRVAAAAATVARWFAEEVCLRRCRKDCLVEPGADGRDLFYAPRHPAGLEESPSLQGPPNFAPADLATWRHLSQRLDDSLLANAALFDGLTAFGFEPRGEDRLPFRRLGDVVRREQAIRAELEQLGDDPASIYSYVEEIHSLEEAAADLRRRLAIAALVRLEPVPGQFGAFRDYPEASTTWRRFQKTARGLGLHEVDLRCLHAAVDRLESVAPFLGMLRALARPPSAARAREIAGRLSEFWNHTPRTVLGSRTPYQAATGSTPVDSLF